MGLCAVICLPIQPGLHAALKWKSSNFWKHKIYIEKILKILFASRYTNCDWYNLSDFSKKRLFSGILYLLSLWLFTTTLGTYIIKLTIFLMNFIKENTIFIRIKWYRTRNRWPWMTVWQFGTRLEIKLGKSTLCCLGAIIFFNI